MEEKFFKTKDGRLIFMPREYMPTENERETADCCDEDSTESINQVLNRFIKTKERLKSNARAALVHTFKSFFNTYPKLKRITWDQYTPYFNDGEPCYFQVFQPDFIFDDNGSDVLLNDLHYYWKWEQELKHDPRINAVGITDPTAFKDFLEAWNSDDFGDLAKLLFGDGVTVSVTRDGVEIEEYLDHD